MTAVQSLVKKARVFNHSLLRAFRNVRSARAGAARDYYLADCAYARFQRDRCMTMARKLRDTGSAF